MAWMARLRKLWKRDELAHELDEELLSHIEMRTRDNIAAGMPPLVARYDAQKRFGNSTLVKERTREMDIVGWIETAGQDLRFAARMFRKAPGFTAIAVLTLALGIGANTAMFTVVQSVVVRPLPYANPSRLIYVGIPNGEGFTNSSWLNYRDVRDQTKTMDYLACFLQDAGVVQGKDGSVSLTASRVTPNLFKMLGIQPLLGRTFTEAEGQTGGPSAVVLSEGLWREAFQADPQIVGRSVRVNGQARTVVGVMPRSFRFPEQAGQDVKKGLWLPIQPTKMMEDTRGYNVFNMLGELKPGVTLAKVQAELKVIATQIQKIDPKEAKDLDLRAVKYQEMVTGPMGPVFTALVVALGLVLLIACANVANLLIARCLGRQQEFAVRVALGAGRLRLMRQQIIEGGLLSLLGCGLGFGLACLCVMLVHKLPDDTIPRADDISVRWSVVLILAAIATATTILSSLLPALMVRKIDPQRALQAGSRGVGSKSVRRRLSGTLVAGEVALSVLLLIATGLLFRTLWNLEHARLGFDTAHVTYFSGMPADATGFGNMTVGAESDQAPPSVATIIYQPALERMRHVPGVEEAALISAAPLTGLDLGSSFQIVGRPKDPAHPMNARVTAVSGRYERVMNTPVIRGRMINEDDTATAPYVVAINEALAREFFAGKDPVGQQIDLDVKTGMTKPYTIVGVLADQVDDGISDKINPLLFLPYQQIPTKSVFYPALLKTLVFFMVKTRGDIPVAADMRTVFHETAPDFAVDNFQTLQKTVDDSNFGRRLGLYLIGGFAGIAVLMVVAGLYGVLAQLVNYRRREIGIRMALGATRGKIQWMVLKQGSVLVGAGLVIGIGIALGLGKLVESFLYKVKPSDVWTYASVVILLLAVGSAAALVPARRAAAVEPVQALREE